MNYSILSRLSLTTIVLFHGIILAPALAFCIESSTQISAKISDGSLTKMIGQLFLIGVPSVTANDDLLKQLDEYPFGNFIFFHRNIKNPAQTKKLSSDLKNYYHSRSLPTPLLAIDQEGGSVTRIPFYPLLPSPQSLGQSLVKNSVQTIASETGRLLYESGLNLNLAPVLDLGSISSSSFVSTRSYSDNPNEMARYAYEYSKELILNRVIPTAKHFPGSLNIAADPHNTSFIYSRTISELNTTELIPFYSFAKLGRFSAVMLAHYSYTAFDNDGTPASMSKNVISYLRDKIKFNGLIITDDFQMKGASSVLSPPEAAFKSLQAGADMVLLSYSLKDQKAAFDRVFTAVKSGEMTYESLQSKLSRISYVKSFLTIKEDRTPASWSSKKLLTLDSEIVDSRIKKIGSQLSKSSKYCVVSSKSHFAKKLVAELEAQNIVVESIKPEQTVSKINCPSIIYTIFSQKSAHAFHSYRLNNIGLNIKAINTSSPAHVIKEDSPYVMDLLFPHSTAAKKIAELLNNSASKSDKF